MTDYCKDHVAHIEHFKRTDVRVGTLEETVNILAKSEARQIELYAQLKESLEDNKDMLREHDRLIHEIKEAPGDRWNQVLGYVLAAIITAIVTLFISGKI